MTLPNLEGALHRQGSESGTPQTQTAAVGGSGCKPPTRIGTYDREPPPHELFDEVETRYGLFAAYLDFITLEGVRLDRDGVEKYQSLSAIVTDATRHPECADLIHMLTLCEETERYKDTLNPMLYANALNAEDVYV